MKPKEINQQDLLGFCEKPSHLMPSLVICYDGRPIGVHLVNHIKEGESAIFHAHIWNKEFRGLGLSSYTYPIAALKFLLLYF